MKLYFLIALLILSMLSLGSITLAMQSDTVSLEVITSDNVDRLQEIATLENLPAQGMSFSPDGTTIVTVGDGLKTWDVNAIITQKAEDVEPLWTFDGRFNDVAYSPDGKIIAAGGIDSSVNSADCECESGATYLLDSETNHQIALLRGRGGQGDTDIRLVDFNRDGSQLAAAEPYAISLWDVRTALNAGFLKMDRDAFMIETDLDKQDDLSHQMMSLDFSPIQSNLLAFATADISDCYEGGCTYTDKRIVLWDTNKHTVLNTLKGHSDWIRDIEFSPHGDLLASASGEIIGHDENYYPMYGSDNTLRLWNVQTGEQIDEFQHSASVVSVAFSPDQNLIASFDHEGVIRLWDITTSSELWTTKGFPDFYSGQIAFSPDGKLLVASVIADDSDTGIHFWGITTIN